MGKHALCNFCKPRSAHMGGTDFMKRFVSGAYNILHLRYRFTGDEKNVYKSLFSLPLLGACGLVVRAVIFVAAHVLAEHAVHHLSLKVVGLKNLPLGEE